MCHLIANHGPHYDRSKTQNVIIHIYRVLKVKALWGLIATVDTYIAHQIFLLSNLVLILFIWLIWYVEDLK